MRLGLLMRVPPFMLPLLMRALLRPMSVLTLLVREGVVMEALVREGVDDVRGMN